MPIRKLGAFLALVVEKPGELSILQFETVVALDEIAETARRLLGQPSSGRGGNFSSFSTRSQRTPPLRVKRRGLN